MTTMTTGPSETEPKVVLDNEPMPEPADDRIDVEATPEPTEPTPAPTDDGEPLPPPRMRGDPKRDEIAQRYREKQAEEAAAARAEAEADDGSEDGDGGSAGAPVEAPEPAAPAATEEPEADKILTLVVHGERQHFKRSDLIDAFDLGGIPDDAIIRIAQKEIAADQRLRKVKERENQSLPDPERPTRAADDPLDPENPPATADANADGLGPDGSPPAQDQGTEEKLTDIVSRIQLGDADEGTAAAREFLKLARLTPEEIAQAVQQSNQQQAHKNEVAEVLGKFARENTDIATDPDLFEVYQSALASSMVQDLKSVGYSDEQLKPILGDRQRIAAQHRRVRNAGFQVRSLEKAFEDTTEYVRTKFKLPKPNPNPGTGGRPASDPHPQPAAPTPDQTRLRIGRKEAAQQQPRQGTARVAPPQGGSRPKTTRDVIADMRAARGFRN